MRIIELPCYGIRIELVDRGSDASGRITSTLTEGEVPGSPMHAIESMVLAHAVAGVDVEAPAYLEGIETAVEACWNHQGELR